ncbi:MAG: glycosyltransferase [Tolypothrix brevis GSE-NOS-MK-07-07A]|nr:glycosyltransferase [Tolypothrix brevis GSE-NOS-MK-07-07A]
MNILIIHNRYQLAGGEDAVVQAEAELLKSYGHDVSVLEVDNDSIIGVWGKAKTAFSAIYSFSSRNLVSNAIAQHNIQVVHIHNFFPLLSPSVYDACRDAVVPVVQTLHNYRLGCPKAMPFREGRVCEECIGKALPLPAVVHGCYRGSRVESAVVASMLAVHRYRQTWQERVDGYIALTQFQKDKLVQAGLPSEKIYIKPNFVFTPDTIAKTSYDGDYALFVGRLSEEKGVATLIDAYKQGSLSIPLKIVGDGPLNDVLQQQVRTLGLENMITFLGRQNKSVVLNLMRNAQFLVFPSIWYEGFPLTIAEAFACSLPVIAAKLGSMAEIVENGVTGLHFEAGNPVDLAAKITWATTHAEAMIAMRKHAHSMYQTRYTPEANYHQLIEIYQLVINKNMSKLASISFSKSSLQSIDSN